jgi:hypothetical protein
MKENAHRVKKANSGVGRSMAHVIIHFAGWRLTP